MPSSGPTAGPMVDAPADPSIQSAQDLAAALGTDLARGLSSAEAARRLAEHGRNELPSAPRQPTWRRVLAHFQDPLIYLLLGAVAIALVAWGIDGFTGWPVDAIVIGLVVAFNGALGYAQEAKAADAVAALARMTEASSAVLRDGQVLRLPSAELLCGDVLVLAEGDAVGADARLIEAASLHMQEASLTGESQAVLKDAATLPAVVPLGDRLNMVYKGTSVAQGTARAVVSATAMATEMGHIAALLEATVEEPTPLQNEISRIGRMLGMAIVIIALVVVATILALSSDRSAGAVIQVLLLGVALAVAAVPEGLPAILSVVLALGVRRMAAQRAVIKKLSSVETLGSASVICSDKTGTLTRAEMSIERVMTLSGQARITGVGYTPEGRIETVAGDASQAADSAAAQALRAEQIVVLSGGSLASHAELRQATGGDWEIHGDPTEGAFLVAERKLGLTERRVRRFTRIGDIAFTSERKMMSTLALDHEQGDAALLISKGAPDMLLERCTRARVGMTVVDLDNTLRARILADVDSLSDAALRTLAVAYRPLAAGEQDSPGEALERELIFVGTVGIIDPPREEAARAILEARRAGIRVIMITGDHPRTAARIAADLGIGVVGAAATAPVATSTTAPAATTANATATTATAPVATTATAPAATTTPTPTAVLTGQQLDALQGAAFTDAVRKVSVYARVSPAHKLRIVDALQADGQVVAMTGDGVNDAPALKAADIGVAMGITGTEVSKEAARMILADDNFATLIEAVREGRNIFDNIRKFLRYLLSSNMGEVLTVFLGVVGASVIGLHVGGTGGGAAGAAAAGVVLPLLATQILWINLVSDSGPALAMGVDPAIDDVMARPPRGRQDRVIDARMWSGVLQIGVVVAIVTLLTIDLYLPGGLIEGSHDLTTARTAGFTVLVFTSLFNCFNARSESASAFTQLFANRWLWAAVALSLVLQVAVVHLGFLNLAFGTAPLSLGQWGVCAAMASGVLWYSELRKLIARQWRLRGGLARQQLD